MGLQKIYGIRSSCREQNRGSSGEGIWIISLKSGEYSKEYGEKSCEDSDELILMEANDNHVENHTVGEFIEWCINGRTEKSGTWESKGTGKYLEGGKAAGGQITDQGFCGRILEGELRFNMVNDVCLGVIHKVPAPGGMSAVGGTGSVYKFYDNNTLSPDGTLKDGIDGFVKTGVKETFFANKEKSADGDRHRVAPEDGPKKVEEGVCVEETITADLHSLLDKFVKEDCPKLMATLELAEEPIPLWWTADFINGSKGECWKPAEGAAKWVVEGHPCWRSGRRNNVWQHRRKGGCKVAGCCLSSLWLMSAAEVSSAPVQVLAASQGMGLLAPCLFSARWQLVAVPSTTYEDARLFLHRLCALFLHWPNGTLL